MLDEEAYLAADGMGLAQLVHDGAASRDDLTRAALARIDKVNRALNAVTFVADHAVLAEQKEEDGQSLLAGVPYLFKDLTTQVAGLPLTNGSKLLGVPEAPDDAETSRRLRRGGLTLLGRTNSPEFGMTPTTEPMRYGPTRNPWNLDFSAGGSSGGSAAAVAAGIVPAAHSTDTMGSIRIPASCCGVFGLKPTRGLVPVGPFRGDANQGFSHEHCISRSVRDSAAILDLIAGPDVGAPFFTPSPERSYVAMANEYPGPLKIGVLDLAGLEVATDCRDAVELAAAHCRTLGHEVTAVRLVYDRDALHIACLTVILPTLRAAAELASARTGIAVKDGVEPLTQMVIERWGTIDIRDFHLALGTINAVVRSVTRQLDHLNVMLTPVMPNLPARIGELAPSRFDPTSYAAMMARETTFTALANASGQPAMSLPLYLSGNGLPIGVQAIGRFGADNLLLQLAAQLETFFIGRSPM